MKTLTPAMAAHLKGETTSLTTCWKITRQDGKQFFYTELDEDIPYLGDIYQSAAGFNKSAIKSSATFAVDEMEVTGFLRDDGISDTEIGNGAFDFAQVEVFMINYEDHSMGKIPLRTGNFGEIKKTESGFFTVELRGLVDQLSQKIGDVYLPECRLDLGEPKCGIKMTPDLHKRGYRVKAGDRIIAPVSAVNPPIDRYFSQLLDPNLGAWPANATMAEDINMSPRKGPKVVTAGASNTFGVVIPLESVGLTQAELQLNDYEVTIRGFYYIYWHNSSGMITLSCQHKPGAFFQDLTSKEQEAQNVVPERKWHPFEISLDIDKDTERLYFKVFTNFDGASGDSGAKKLCWDDLELVISPRERGEEPGFEQYGGVEFIAQTDGVTSQADVDFDKTLGALTVDGSVTWEAVLPRYTFLGSVTATSPLTNTVNAAPIPVAEGWFDWGVLKFLTGNNAGRAVEVMSYNLTTGQIKTALPLPYQAQPGDQFSINAGCDKRDVTCIDKFNNILNFRGHNRVPGQGAYFKVAGIE